MLQIKRRNTNNNKQILTLSCAFVLRSWSLECQRATFIFREFHRLALHVSLAFQMQENEHRMACDAGGTRRWDAMMFVLCTSHVLLGGLVSVTDFGKFLAILTSDIYFAPFPPSAPTARMPLGVWASVPHSFPPGKFLLSCLRVHAFFPWICQASS